jgi:hypothetical protein
MTTKEITVKTGSKEKGNLRQGTFHYSIPDTLEEARTTYGDALVHSQFVSALVLSIQSPARKLLETATDDMSPEQVSTHIANGMSQWKLGEKRPRTKKTTDDSITDLASKWPSLSEEKKMQIAAMFGFAYTPSTQGANGAAPEVEAAPERTTARRR